MIESYFDNDESDEDSEVRERPAIWPFLCELLIQSSHDDGCQWQKLLTKVRPYFTFFVSEVLCTECAEDVQLKWKFNLHSQIPFVVEFDEVSGKPNCSHWERIHPNILIYYSQREYFLSSTKFWLLMFASSLDQNN